MPMRKVGIWLLGVTATAVVLFGLLISQPISRIKDTPMMRRISRLYHIGTKFRHYADKHSVFPDGSTINSNLDALVTIGILSTEDGAYIRTNHIAYRGYDLRRVAEDVVVFECVFSNTTPPQEIIAYSDGHVLTRGLRRTQ